jgi:tetratricopeptide (TPR) repeat protein
VQNQQFVVCRTPRMQALSLQALRDQQLHDSEASLIEAEQKLVTINQQIQRLSTSIDSSCSISNKPSSDWTKIYENCAKWEELESLQEQKSKEQEKIQGLLEKQDTLGHYHDHSIERQFFERPEHEKIIECERNKVLGNYLFSEGNYIDAAEHYQVAISYYEYCFPEDEKVQIELDQFRHHCLLNLALCQIRLQQYRSAIDSVNKVIQENNQLLKAFYRKAVAHRHLDEYEYVLHIN